ncbi:MAG: sulfatase [Acidobacteriia bacterium]|nr:sulfatase [Terriglobia bacterium]
MVTRPAGTGKYVLGGALHGAVVWGAYSVIEQAISVASPLWRGCESVPGSSYWRVIATVMSSFVVLGIALGAVSGLALKMEDDRAVAARRRPLARRFRSAAVVALASASSVSWALVRPFGKVEALCFSVSVGLAASLVFCETHETWGDRLGFLGNPWVAGLLMFGGGWIGRRALDNSVQLVQFAGAVGTVLVVGCAGLLGSRVWRMLRLPADSVLPVRAGAILALAGAVVLGLAPSATRWGLPPAQPWQLRGSPGRPNIILVTMDTVRADHLSLYGYARDTTPFLKEFAREATVYEEAVATSNLTLTTHASLFTGLYGSWNGVYLAPPELPQGRPLSRRHPTLAQVLSANGYRTMAVVANYGYLGPGFGLTRGFETSYVLAPAVASSPFLLRSHLGPLVDALVSSDELSVKFSRAGEVNRAASALLVQAQREAVPFFLFVNYMDAHTPYVPPAPFNTLFPGRERSLRFADYQAMQAQVMHGERGVSAEERRHFVSQYDGGIRYLDSQLARLVAQLKGLGLFQNSMIVITSDHGEAFGEHDLLGHGYSLYQDQVHVPLIIKYPNQEQPRVIGTLVSQVDVMPTVLSALGIPTPAQTQGDPLQDLEHDTSRFVMSESFPNDGFGPRFVRMERAVFSGTTKLIAMGNGGRELFDLAGDPEEVNNRYRPDDPAARALGGRLEEWLKGKPLSGGVGGSVDEDALRRLRSLGYVQ